MLSCGVDYWLILAIYGVEVIFMVIVGLIEGGDQPRMCTAEDSSLVGFDLLMGTYS